MDLLKSRAEFDPLFDLAKYANLDERERKMYNDSLKHKWDNENVMDYAIKTANKEARYASSVLIIKECLISLCHFYINEGKFQIDSGT